MKSKSGIELNIWISGTEGSGKTSFLLQNSFKAAVGSDQVLRYTKRYKYNNRLYSFKAVESSMSNPAQELLQECQAILICFNLSDRTSYDSVKEHITRIKEKAGPEAIYCLVATFNDVVDRPKISKQEVAYYCKMNNVEFADVSCLSGYNVKEPLMKIIKAYNQKYKLEENEISDRGLICISVGTMLGFFLIMVLLMMIKEWIFPKRLSADEM